MLFRSTHGKLVEICRENYVNDSEYYNAILRVKGVKFPKTIENHEERIIKAFKSNISKTMGKQ